MSALSDQITYLGSPTNPTENRSDPSSPRPSSQSNGHDLASPGGENSDKFQPLFDDDTAWSVTSMVAGLVLAVALAVGHHAFLNYLDGRNVADFSQQWIKGAGNGFSNGFSICLGFSAAAALTQMKWRVSGNEPLPMYTIDHLFALPAPMVLLKTLMHPRRSLFLPILSSVLIQALVIVSILAPTTLTIAPSEQVSRDIQVSTLDISNLQEQFAKGSYGPLNPFNGSTFPQALYSLNMSAAGEQKINHLLLNLPEIPWTIPPGCGLECAFHFEYEAPILDCHDIILDDYHYDPKVEFNFDIYRASTALYPQYSSFPPGDEAAIPAPSSRLNVPYDLSINYTIYNPNFYDLNANSNIYRRAGTYCRFRWGTYNASFKLGSNSQRLKTSIISYSDYYLSLSDTLVDGTGWREDSGDRYPGFPGVWAICYAFADAFRTNISSGLIPTETYQISPILHTVFNFSYEPDGPFELGVPNLSQTLVDMFSNLTLSLIPTTTTHNHTITVSAAVWDGTSVWIYTTWILWAVYIPALTLAIPVILYGLFTIHMSGIGMDDKFSSFLLATRNEELDEICKESADFEEMQRFRLIHRERGTFTVDSGLKSPI